MAHDTPATNPVMEAATCATNKNVYGFTGAANIYSVGGAANAHPAVVAKTIEIAKEMSDLYNQTLAKAAGMSNGGLIGGFTVAGASQALLGNVDVTSVAMGVIGGITAKLLHR